MYLVSERLKDSLPCNTPFPLVVELPTAKFETLFRTGGVIMQLGIISTGNKHVTSMCTRSAVTTYHQETERFHYFVLFYPKSSHYLRILELINL